MNIKPVTVGGVALAAATGAALLLTGCGSTSSTATSSTAPASATANSAASPASSGGSGSSASVDGKAIAANFTTTCAQRGGILALALADLNNGTYGRLAVTATVTAGNTVQAVGIAGTKGGTNGLAYALGYGAGAQGGSASVSKSGNTFTVNGSGVGAFDPSNPTAGPTTTKFAITFACPTIVGG